MPSAALLHRQTDRTARLGLVASNCAALLASPAPVVAPLAPSSGLPPFAGESLQGYVMLVSGHFQGFCRDIYTECAQEFASALSLRFRNAVQIQFGAELRLNIGNPTIENIRRDFERFGFTPDLAQNAPGNSTRITQLGHLNYWRNAAAHQKSTPPSPGVPGLLTLANIQA